MDWGKFVYLLFIILIGYFPYKTILRFRKDGLSSISTRSVLLLSIWFFILSALLIIQTPYLYIDANIASLIFIIVTVFFWFRAPWILPRIGWYPEKALKENPKWYVMHGKPKMFLLKFCEVLFQQAKFAYLLFVVLDGLTVVPRIWWFTGIVSFLHFFNIFFVPAGWFFFLVSIPMGPLFSWFILKGLIFVALSIHLWFYLILVAQYWLRAKFSNK